MSMNSIIAQSAKALTQVASKAAKFMPEPAVQGVGVFKDAMKIAADVSGNALGGVSSEVFGDFEDLINTQIQVQKEFQSVAMLSNIERSRHEGKMSAIRNIRVG